MEILKNVILALHIIGVAALLGGALYQMKSIRSGQARVLPAMMHGAWTMLVTGVALVGMAYALGNGEYVDNLKITIKLAVLVAIVVIGLVYRKKETVPTWVVPTIGGLTVVNVLLATIW